MPLPSREPIDLLLVDDNPGDVRLLTEVFKRMSRPPRVATAGDGIEALNYLRRQPPHQEARRPDVILLDLKMPRMDGRETLAILKNDPDLRRIPVVVLTSSPSAEDILMSYDLHANCYLTKPVDFDELQRTLRAFEEFWLKVVRLPPKGAT